eukprot:c14553_g1_i1 orf=113-376(+)
MISMLHSKLHGHIIKNLSIIKMKREDKTNQPIKKGDYKYKVPQTQKKHIQEKFKEIALERSGTLARASTSKKSTARKVQKVTTTLLA